MNLTIEQFINFNPIFLLDLGFELDPNNTETQKEFENFKERMKTYSLERDEIFNLYSYLLKRKHIKDTLLLSSEDLDDITAFIGLDYQRASYFKDGETASYFFYPEFWKIIQQIIDLMRSENFEREMLK